MALRVHVKTGGERTQSALPSSTPAGPPPAPASWEFSKKIIRYSGWDEMKGPFEETTVSQRIREMPVGIALSEGPGDRVNFRGSMHLALRPLPSPPSWLSQQGALGP